MGGSGYIFNRGIAKFKIKKRYFKFLVLLDQRDQFPHRSRAYPLPEPERQYQTAQKFQLFFIVLCHYLRSIFALLFQRVMRVDDGLDIHRKGPAHDDILERLRRILIGGILLKRGDDRS